MMQITKLINKYIKVQNSLFDEENRKIYFLQTCNKEEVFELVKVQYNNFSVILESNQSFILITNYCYSNLFKNFVCLENIVNVNDFLLCSVNLVIRSPSDILLWSPVFNQLVINMEKHNISFTIFDYYTLGGNIYEAIYKTKTARVVLETKKFETFRKYITSYSSGFCTKNSDFMVKNMFNSLHNKSPKYVSMLDYLQKHYKNFIYGYIVLNDADYIKTIYDFWFKDLFLVGCDIGLGHLWGQFGSRFYFVIACDNAWVTKSKIMSLVCSYKIVLINYEKDLLSFVEEYMHYPSEQSYLNSYFLGIYNNENWLLYENFFYEIYSELLFQYCSVEGAIFVKDDLTVEEKYYYRFAYLRLPETGYYPEAFEEDNVPWLALPKPLLALEKKSDNFSSKRVEEEVISKEKKIKLESLKNDITKDPGRQYALVQTIDEKESVGFVTHSEEVDGEKTLRFFETKIKDKKDLFMTKTSILVDPKYKSEVLSKKETMQDATTRELNNHIEKNSEKFNQEQQNQIRIDESITMSEQVENSLKNLKRYDTEISEIEKKI